MAVAVEDNRGIANSILEFPWIYLEPRFEYHNTISHCSFQIVIDYDDFMKIPYLRSVIENLKNEAVQLRYLSLLSVDSYFFYILSFFTSYIYIYIYSHT